MAPTPPNRPAKNSRKFTTDARFDRQSPSFAQPDDYFSQSSKKQQRSTAYARPLAFADAGETTRRSDRSDTVVPLTEANLHHFQIECEANQRLDHPEEGSDPRFADPNFFAFMRNFKPKPSSKQKTERKRYKDHEHPLNLPPDELKRLSQRLARDDPRSSQLMDVDMSDNMSGEAQVDTGSNSHPSTPGSNAPGAFPSSEPVNGDMRENTKSPTPPPHRVNTQPRTDPEAAKAAGNKFFKAKDYSRAVAEYSKAIEADPKNPTYLSNRAAAYMSDNRFQLALQDCLQASTLDPDNEKVLHRLARIYTSLGRPEDALGVYAKLPNASAADTGAAMRAKQSIEMAEKQINSADGDMRMALWNLEQAKQTLGYGAPMPRRWQILKAKANLKVGSSNALGEVQGIAQTLMRDNPMDAEAMTLAGQAFYLKDEKGVGKTDYQRAEECFRKALSFDPDMAEARDCLRTMKKLERAKTEANDSYKRGKWQEAVDAYGQCLEIDPSNKITNAKILGNRALARSKIEQFEEAKADCDAALRLDPTYTKAKKTRAKIVGEQGDWEQAVKDLKSLADENPGDADVAKELRNAELELKKSKRKDWYKILGVAKDASDKDIERAYKKKAAILHPDKTQGDKEKEELFKDCLEAKETLLDPQKRQIYDSGADLMEPGMGGSPFGGGFGGMGGGVQIDPEMLFNMMGGMGGARGGGMGGGFPGGFTFTTSGGPGMGGRGGGFPF